MCVIQLILKMLKNKLLSVAKMAGNLGQILLFLPKTSRDDTDQ